MKVVTLGDVEKIAARMEGASGIAKQVPISRNDGSPSFSFRVFTFEPGGHTPFHTHPNEHINYVIEGEGVVVREDGGTCPIKKGDFALILPNEKHQYRNQSRTGCLVVICAVPSEYE
jgi:quercetin dioxygenase-like cupin family protein